MHKLILSMTLVLTMIITACSTLQVETKEYTINGYAERFLLEWAREDKLTTNNTRFLFKLFGVKSDYKVRFYDNVMEVITSPKNHKRISAIVSIASREEQPVVNCFIGPAEVKQDDLESLGFSWMINEETNEKQK